MKNEVMFSKESEEELHKSIENLLFFYRQYFGW